MELKLTYKQIWQIAYPMILGSVAQNIINVTDTAFLGRVGEIELGAAAIAGLFYFAIIMIGWGMGSGAQIIIARRYGEKKYLDIGKVFDNSLFLMIGLAVITFFVMYFLSPILLGFVLKSNDIHIASSAYLNVRSWGVLFALTNVVFRVFFVGIASTSVISWTTGIMAFINVVLDYIFIFGHFGAPEMGIQGAALASVIAEMSATFIFIIYMYRKSEYRKFGLFQFDEINKKLVKLIMRVSYPIMIQHIISLGGWFIFFLIIERMGEHELAISNIIRSVYMVFMIPTWGFNAAVNTMVSNFLGQKNNEAVLKVTKMNVLLSLVCSLIVIQASIFFPKEIISIFTSNEMIINDGVYTLYVLNVAIVSLSVCWVLFNALLGTGDTKIALKIEVICITAYLLYAYYIAIILQCSLEIAWTSEMVYIWLMGIFSYIYLVKGNWKKIKV